MSSRGASHRWRWIAATTVVVCAALGCAPPEPGGEREAKTAQGVAAAATGIERNPTRNAYFGDLHVHTQYSFDAFVFGTRTTPDDAYRFARGEPIAHPGGYEIALETPLDFQAVTDHASYLGMLAAMQDPDSRAGRHPDAEVVRNAVTPAGRLAAFRTMGGYFTGARDGTGLLDLGVVRSAWQNIIEAAERHNEPGVFTTFIGYEYTSSGPAQENLHRNVVFQGRAVAPLPFSRLDSTNPEALWGWLDGLRDDGIEALAIPHNANGSNGLMFELETWADGPIDAAYAELRMRNEPLVEITQVKGTSETHPLLSPNDEWSDFEIMDVRVASDLPSAPAGSYVRDAYLRGLVLEARTGANPYRFGMAGASDTHVSGGSFDESRYWSKVGVLDATPELRGSVPVRDAAGSPEYVDNVFSSWGASGLTGVWAQANTRDDIYAAFRRKETWATSGTRIRVRFFAGFELSDDPTAHLESLGATYEKLVPMGAELSVAGDAVPEFLVWAARAPDGAPLERVQIVKGWVVDGEAREQVFDVACAAGEIDTQSQRCPAGSAQVDLNDCSTSGEGAGELSTVWRDPGYAPGERAFYYVRVLENPTCRWSTWDALRAGVAPRAGLAPTIQERAWSSPIWLAP